MDDGGGAFAVGHVSKAASRHAYGASVTGLGPGAESSLSSSTVAENRQVYEETAKTFFLFLLLFYVTKENMFFFFFPTLLMCSFPFFTVSLCLRVRLSLSRCVCVCEGGERERERETHTDTHAHTQRDGLPTTGSLICSFCFSLMVLFFLFLDRSTRTRAT